jgi:hypothetical protein
MFLENLKLKIGIYFNEIRYFGCFWFKILIIGGNLGCRVSAPSIGGVQSETQLTTLLKTIHLRRSRKCLYMLFASFKHFYI